MPNSMMLSLFHLTLLGRGTIKEYTNNKGILCTMGRNSYSTHFSRHFKNRPDQPIIVETDAGQWFGANVNGKEYFFFLGSIRENISKRKKGYEYMHFSLETGNASTNG